jgi:hypothetical protein
MNEDWFNAVSDMRLPPAVDGRMRELMDRNNEGQLSAAERAELRSLVEASETISLLKAEALKRRPRDAS